MTGKLLKTYQYRNKWINVHPFPLVRVVSITLICAFLKFYAIIPVAIIIITNIIIAFVATWRCGAFFTVLASFCAPFTFNPESPPHRFYLRISLLTTNLILIPCLVFIFFLPSIIPPEILIQTQGFQHLNFNISGKQFLVNDSPFGM